MTRMMTMYTRRGGGQQYLKAVLTPLVHSFHCLVLLLLMVCTAGRIAEARRSSIGGRSFQGWLGTQLSLSISFSITHQLVSEQRSSSGEDQIDGYSSPKAALSVTAEQIMSTPEVIHPGQNLFRFYLWPFFRLRSTNTKILSSYSKSFWSFWTEYMPASMLYRTACGGSARSSRSS